MFTKSASFYDRLYSFKDYASEATALAEVLKHANPSASTLLDVGCGTGVHLRTLDAEFKVEGLDLDRNLLDVARSRLPSIVFHEADMTSFDTGRRYDVVVCLFSAIGYVRTTERMKKTVACMARHLENGGVLAIEPWFSPDNFWTGNVTLNTVKDDDMSIAWMYVARRENDLAVLDIHYMVGRSEGVATFQERHELGLFTDDEYRAALLEAGLGRITYLPEKPMQRGLYVAQKIRS